jgi:quercetin dioxygenase-like cupin family protein
MFYYIALELYTVLKFYNKVAKTKLFEEKTAEEESEELPANCVTGANFVKVYDNKLYEVSDLHIPDGQGNIAFTITRTKLHPGKQTRGNARDQNRIVEIKEGEGIFQLNSLFVQGRAGVIMVVPAGVKMKVINFKDKVDLLYFSTLPAQLVRADAKRTGLV